jgi:tetratricopeptide (TPR) repeat protein
VFANIIAKCLIAVASGALAEPAASPTPAADKAPQQVQQLIRQLGDKDYFVRQRAETELSKMGFDAFDALSEATASDDLEIASRAQHLLRTMKVPWLGKGDPAAVQQLLHDYEYQSQEGRLAKMRALVALPGEVGIPALCRIVRYEKSSLLSKQAAIQLLYPEQKAAPPPKKETGDLLRKGLGDCQRPGALWLLQWARANDDPSFPQNWSKLVDAEESLLGAAPSQTSPEIVAVLLKVQVARLRAAEQNEAAVAAVRRLIKLEKGDPATLSSLLQYLVEQKAWKAVDELAERFGPQIGVHASLLYAVAEAQAAQGDKTRAEQTAHKALKLNPGTSPQDVIAHLITAARLQQRGQFDWAKRELQNVVANGQPTNEYTLAAQFRLSEMLHDQGQDQEAAQVLEAVEKTLAANAPATKRRSAGKSLAEVRARMNYFLACHWQAQGDQGKQRESLLKALVADTSDIDLLIAAFHMPDQQPEQQQKVRRLIDKEVADLREQIADNADDPTNYNQLAWLIANTVGDLDEALRCSRASIEKSPDRDIGGYYDTLAHVYFAKKDYENAVKHQTKAAEMEPHSGQILRKLDLFRKKLDEQKKADGGKKPEGKP